MSANILNYTTKLRDYLLSTSLRDTETLAELRAETAKLSQGVMQICPEQGQFMALLIELLGAKKTLEIGVFTGYSALSVALALPHDGELIACDINEEWTNVAKKYWKKAQVDHKIKLHLAPADVTLNKLITNGHIGTFDFCFIDADKENYLSYYENALTLLRPNGLILVDNVLWSGKVADFNKQDEETVALRKFNEKLYSDNRVSLSMLPIGDGLTLARKR